MTQKKMPATAFVTGLSAALKRGDGYIMGATGQNPRKWSASSWWFTQYTSATQRAKALYWREHAARVWDCNGLAEGLYKDWSGLDINTQAKFNYATWCGIKGAGMIPAARRIPGAAVFWGKRASSIHHVAYLYRPVNAEDPAGDWYLIEARGVMYGVVQTRLYSRKPDFWGLMDRYFDYSVAATDGPRDLQQGCLGMDVTALQEDLLALGYDLGPDGADGDFGPRTEQALILFQRDRALAADGICGPATREALAKAKQALRAHITGDAVYVRSAPEKTGHILGVARKGETLPLSGMTDANGWIGVIWREQPAWVSGKYAEVRA